MITLPMKFLRVMLAAVTYVRKAKAFNAGMYRHAKIGRKEWMLEYNDLKNVEVQLESLVLEARLEKRKNFSITIYPIDIE